MSRLIPILVFVFLLALAYLFFTSLIVQPISQSDSLSLGKPVECSVSQTKECSLDDGCSGTSYCTNGKWGDCIIPKICTTGTTIDCGLGCNIGYKECNSCGTGYSECIYS